MWGQVSIPVTTMPFDSFAVPTALIELLMNICCTSPLATVNTSFNPGNTKNNNEHSGGCRRQPSTPAEGGRRAKLVCRYRVYHLSEAIKLKTRRLPAGFVVLQSHHSHTCKFWGTSAFSP